VGRTGLKEKLLAYCYINRHLSVRMARKIKTLKNSSTSIAQRFAKNKINPTQMTAVGSFLGSGQCMIGEASEHSVHTSFIKTSHSQHGRQEQVGRSAWRPASQTQICGAGGQD